METKTYEVKIRLQAEEGSLPTEYELERLVADQMSGVLDDDTSLKAIAVFDPKVVENGKPTCCWCDEPATHRDEEGGAVTDYYCDTHLEIWGDPQRVVAL